MGRSCQSELSEQNPTRHLFSIKRFLPMITIMLSLIVLTLISTPALAADPITLKWNVNTDGNTDGYMLFLKNDPQGEYDYNTPFWTGTNVYARLDGLQSGATYYFVVRAFGEGGVSTDSNEATFTAP